jgi:MFS family permease
MPSVGADLGGYGWFGWATAGFLLGSVVAGASAGWLSERVGLRAATVFAGLVYAAGCALSAAGPDIATFLVGRVVQGVAGGWIAGFAYVAIAVLFPERHLGRVFAAITAVWGVATLVGPLLGGLFAQAGAWRGVFWLFAGQAIVFSLAAVWLLRRAQPAKASAGVPWPQLLVLTAGVCVIGFSDRIGGLGLAATAIGAGLALIGAMLWLDRRSTVRLLPVRAADVGRTVGAGYLALFALEAATKGLAIYGPVLLQSLQGLTALEAGYVIASEAAGWTVVALMVSGAGAPRDPLLIRVGSAIVLVSAVVLAGVMPGTRLWPVLVGAVLMGAGFGFAYASINRRVLAALADDERAVGGSGLGAVRQTGAAVGAALCGVAANFAGLSTGPTPDIAGAAAVNVFGFAVPVALLGVWAAFRLARS